MYNSSDQEIFNAPALDAARQFRFTPATIKGKPVDVRVSVPFKFRLAEKRETEGWLKTGGAAIWSCEQKRQARIRMFTR